MVETARSSQEYIPGMCNIGPAERRRRRMGGIAGTVVTIALFAILVAVDAPLWWRLILLFPAAGAATGFLQDALHFCVGFGMKGIYNVINSAGVVDNVELEEFRLKDKKKAQTILIWSALIGLAVAGLSLIF